LRLALQVDGILNLVQQFVNSLVGNRLFLPLFIEGAQIAHRISQKHLVFLIILGVGIDIHQIDISVASLRLGRPQLNLLEDFLLSSQLLLLDRLSRHWRIASMRPGSILSLVSLRRTLVLASSRRLCSALLPILMEHLVASIMPKQLFEPSLQLDQLLLRLFVHMGADPIWIFTHNSVLLLGYYLKLSDSRPGIVYLYFII